MDEMATPAETTSLLGDHDTSNISSFSNNCGAPSVLGRVVSESVQDPATPRVGGDESYERETSWWPMRTLFALSVALMTWDASLEFAAFYGIGEEFRQVQNIQWLTLSYTMAVNIAQPLYSRLSDLTGRKPPLIFSQIAFLIGIMTFVMPDKFFWLRVAARGLVGIGASGMGLMVSIILNDHTPLKNRALWQVGLIQFPSLVGQSISLFMGWCVLEKLKWRLTFLFEAPAALILAVLGFKMIHLPNLKTNSQRRNTVLKYHHIFKKENFDYAGSSMLTVTLVLLAYNLNCTSQDTTSSVLWALNFIFFVAFLWIESRVTEIGKTLIPFEKLAGKEFVPIFLAALAANGIATGLLFSIPFFVNTSEPKSKQTTESSHPEVILIFIFGFGSILGSLIYSLVAHYSKRLWYAPIWASAMALLTSMYIWQYWTGLEGNWEKRIPVFASGAATGIIILSLHIKLLNTCENEDKAVLYGVFHLFISLGSMISISVISAVKRSQFSKNMHSKLKLPVDDVGKLVIECMKSLECLDKVDKHVRSIIQSCFLDALKCCFGCIFGVACFIFVVVFFIPRNDVIRDPVDFIESDDA